MFPIEIWLKILAIFPANNAGARTLASCYESGKSSLREASLDPTLWKPYYKQRYEHESPEKVFSGNWREKYFARRLTDLAILKHLDAIVEATARKTRIDHARVIIQHGLNAWDVLQIESKRPLPVLFQTEEDVLKVREGHSLTNLTKKYWALELLKNLARRDAILCWSRVGRGLQNRDVPYPSFEEAYSCISSFYGFLGEDILKDVRSIAAQCIDHLEGLGISYHPEANDFDALELYTAICRFMKTLDFYGAPPQNFYDYHNSFPHLFLTEKRQTFSISLVFIFVVITSTLGFRAIPVNTQGRVVALVSPVVVNVYDFLIYTIHPARSDYYNGPALTIGLLARAARNISVALERLPENAITMDVLFARYTISIIRRLFNYSSGDVDCDWLPSLMSMYHVFPFDPHLVIQDALIPSVNELSTSEFPRTGKDLHDLIKGLDDNYETLSEANVTQARIEDLKIVTRLFIGQIVQNDAGAYGCITGFVESKEDESKDPDEYKIIWFYAALPEAEAQRPHIAVPRRISSDIFWRFVPELPYIGCFFEDAEFISTSESIESASGRIGIGRLIPNHRLRHLYPDDDRYGACWIRSQANSEEEKKEQ